MTKRLGPYRGYYGHAARVYDCDQGLIHGEVDVGRDVVTFQAKNYKDLEKAFQDSVDDYLDFTKKS